jgi:hypothetical protein
MRRLLGCVALMVMMAGSAWGHFVFLLPGKDSKAEAVFNDSPAPDSEKLLDKIKHSTFAVGGKKLSAEKAGGVLRVEHAGDKAAWVTAECPYGVVEKGKVPFRLTYYAKTAVNVSATKRLNGKLPDGRGGKLDIEVSLNGKRSTARVTWDGKPVAAAEVVLYVPGEKDEVKLETGKDGLVALKQPTAKGVYAIRARHAEKAKGKHDGKDYEEDRAYATATFTVD